MRIALYQMSGMDLVLEATERQEDKDIVRVSEIIDVTFTPRIDGINAARLAIASEREAVKRDYWDKLAALKLREDFLEVDGNE